MICPPDTPIAKQAMAAGASLVGEDEVFDAIKAGRIDFDRCICHKESTKKLQQANLGRILGPRGLMPNEKLGTITANVGQAVQGGMVGSTEYKETLGVVRCANWSTCAHSLSSFQKKRPRVYCVGSKGHLCAERSSRQGHTRSGESPNPASNLPADPSERF